jgi:CubicO group peptidase (beta-lactamase class C family)
MLRTILVWMFPAMAVAGSVAPRNIDELRTALQEALTRYQVPGAGVAIVTAERVVWAGGVGKADLASGRDVSADTMFRLGSVSKSFVALALVRLAAEGRLDLDATLESVAPEVAAPNPWRATHPVRIAHVLEHTAGFDEARFAQDYLPRGAPEVSLLSMLQRFPGPQRVRWPPGTRFSYSNPGYVVAAHLIEKVTGCPYDQYIRDAILRPLGMQRSGFRLTDANRARLAQGYNHRPSRPVAYRQSYIAPAGDFMSSPAEFVPFLQALLRREFPRLDRVERGQTSIAAQAGIAMYGLGSFPFSGGYRRHGHSGMIEGFRSSYFYLPDAGVAYVVMSNTSMPGGGSAELYRIVHEYATAGIPRRTAPAVFEGNLQLEQLAGVYMPRDHRSQIAAISTVLPRVQRVTVRNGALHVAGLLGEGSRTLVPVTATTFRRPDEVEATWAFSGDVMTGRAGHFERVPAWQPYAYAGTVVAALLIMASSIVCALVWIWRRATAARMVPLLAVLCLAAAGLLITAGVDDMSALGYVNARTVGYWAFSWAFVALAVLGVFLASRPLRVYPLLVSIACCVVAAALADWGVLGIRLWQY